MREPWTYCQAVAFLAYGSIEVAARYGGRDNEPDGGKGRRDRDLRFPLRSGLPGIDAVLAIKDRNERDIALHGTKATTTRWRGVGLGKNKPPGERTIECRNRDGWEAADEERWKAGVKKLYQAMLTGAVTVYRGTAAYAPNNLIHPVPAENWRRGLADVERCRFDATELFAAAGVPRWAQASRVGSIPKDTRRAIVVDAQRLDAECGPLEASDPVDPESSKFFEPADPVALKQFRAHIAALRSFTLLDATARIVDGAAYDKRYATLPGDTDSEQAAQRRRKHDQRNASWLTIAAPSVRCEPPGGAGIDSVPHSRITPPRKTDTVANIPDVIIEAKKKAKDAEAVAWGAAERQLCDWLWKGRIEALDGDGRTVPSTFWAAVSKFREASARGYRVRADGLLALIEGCTSAAVTEPRSIELRKAPKAVIRKVMHAVYDAANRAAPNLRTWCRSCPRCWHACKTAASQRHTDRCRPLPERTISRRGGSRWARG
jgi:hypothetical protein